MLSKEARSIIYLFEVWEGANNIRVTSDLVTNGKFNIYFPPKIEGAFFCSGCRLTSLVGSPQYVDGDFNCQNNHLNILEILKDFPKYVGGDFICNNQDKPVLRGDNITRPPGIEGSFIF